ncbi:PHP domain-containing protein [Candidatus Chlorohelix sp.]|uniref:PHP domain-containing protein n=1 Tax=Candidatus Chlorohelix sp. TaxID=3139201 RepID=UPI00306E8C9E
MKSLEKLNAKPSIDLHTHTSASDGKWSPQDLINVAAAQKIQTLSVCDHETTANLKTLQLLARMHGIQFISGVEIAVEHRNKNYHLLLYGFNPESIKLQMLLKETRQKLLEKRQTMALSLLRKGYDLEGLTVAHSTSPIYELASALVEANTALTFRQAWDICRSVEPEMKVAQPLEKALAVGRCAGAVSILAHPGRGGAETAVASDEVLKEMAGMGLEGIEGFYSGHSQEETARLLQLGRKRNLLVSCGSDSHDEHKKPIAWNAELCRGLLERLGIESSALAA